MTDAKPRPWHLYVLGLIAVVVIVIAISEIGAPSSSARTSTEIVTAEKGVVQSSVSGSGNVEAGVDVDVNFQTSGTLEHVYVKQGQHVIKGQLLAELNPASAQLTYDQAEENLTSAEDDLTSAEDGSSGSSTDTSLDKSSGSADTDFVSYDPARADVASTDPSSSTTSTTTTTTTVTTTTTATPSFPTTTTTSSETTPSHGSYPTTTTSETTSSSPESGRSGSGYSGSGGTTGSGSGGSDSGGSSSTSSAGSVASAQASVDSAEASLDSARQALADTQLHAPVGGTIVSLADLEPGDSVSSGSTTSDASSSSSSSSSSDTGASGITAGDLGGDSSSSSDSSSTGSSSTFAEIVNSKTLTMTVAFSESDISKIKVGQAATVTLDALTGVELGAHVSSISLVGTTSSSVVSYDATLTLDQNDSQVKPGMSASAEVITQQANGVNVPNDAVTGSGSLATVNLVKNGKTSSQQVVVGLQGTSRTQILSGLSAGDQIEVKTTLPALGSSSSTSGSSSTGTLGGTSGFGGRAFGGGGFGGAGFGGAGFAGRVP